MLYFCFLSKLQVSPWSSLVNVVFKANGIKKILHFYRLTDGTLSFSLTVFLKLGYVMAVYLAEYLKVENGSSWRLLNLSHGSHQISLLCFCQTSLNDRKCQIKLTPQLGRRKKVIFFVIRIMYRTNTPLAESQSGKWLAQIIPSGQCFIFENILDHKVLSYDPETRKR